MFVKAPTLRCVYCREALPAELSRAEIDRVEEGVIIIRLYFKAFCERDNCMITKSRKVAINIEVSG
jgi:hypothetical protein